MPARGRARMSAARETLRAIEQKHRRFRQQQLTFVAALGRTREHARERTQPVSSIAQVQRYLDNHCNNATDRRILSLFLEIVADLRGAAQLLEGLAPENRPPDESLEACKALLCPTSDLSALRAKYPHDEVNHLSCDEARNYYGGVVSLIPMATDLAWQCVSGAGPAHKAPKRTAPPSLQGAQPGTEQQSSSAKERPAIQAVGTQTKRGGNAMEQLHYSPTKGQGGWHTGKPAWRPPGRTSKF
ncbi:sperm acrosome-associated protein 9 isoform X1 [Lepisosteus oculatus]|uniref:sperm acrosome-associated protein 9 isoform X1 n=2 Tax=Lepisosteus oculatus TaxID=7918 RepID=UPI003713886F